MGIEGTETTPNADYSAEVTVNVSLGDLNLSKPVPLDSKVASFDEVAKTPAVSYTFADAKIVSPTKVEITFSDGSTWLFHSAWLLDSCRSQVRHNAASTHTRHYDGK